MDLMINILEKDNSFLKELLLDLKKGNWHNHNQALIHFWT